MKKSALIAVLCLFCFTAHAEEEKLTTLTGFAYAQDGGELLYQEFHQFAYEGEVLVGDQVEYRRPDGSVIGNKRLDFRKSLFVPAFETQLYDGLYVEGLRYEGDDIVLYRREGKDAKEESKRIKHKDAMAADAGFNNYVHERFDELQQGDTVKFHFVAASRLISLKFVAERVADRMIEDTPVMDIKVAISSFLSLFVDPLQLSYDTDTRFLIEYQGLSNVRDEAGEMYKVRIRYPQFMRTAAAVAQTQP